jgi:large conductance mechanosensitive channel
MLKGFRDFILRGNVVDLAVAVVIGAAFTAIVNSLVTNIINPLIAAIVQKPDFSALTLNVNFFVVLPVSKLLARFHPPVVAAPTTKPCPQCLSDIPVAATRCSHCTQLVA